MWSVKTKVYCKICYGKCNYGKSAKQKAVEKINNILIFLFKCLNTSFPYYTKTNQLPYFSSFYLLCVLWTPLLNKMSRVNHDYVNVWVCFVNDSSKEASFFTEKFTQILLSIYKYARYLFEHVNIPSQNYKNPQMPHQNSTRTLLGLSIVDNLIQGLKHSGSIS